MQHVIESYACEWQRAVSDPAVRRRFRHFVNSEAADTHVMFVESRGQIRPATPAERMQAAGMTSIKAA
jgi:nitrite reductase (NADH) large subunit